MPSGNHHEWQDERWRNEPRGAAHSVDDGQGSAAAAGVPFHVREVLRRGGSEQEETEDRADEPGFEAEHGLHRRPPGDLEQDATRNRDRDVRPDPEPLGSKRRHRIEDRDHRRDHHNPEALAAVSRRGEPGEDERGDIRRDSERPRVAQAQPAGGQRPAGLVDAIDFEVVDLIQRVRRRIQHRRHRQAECRIQEQLAGEGFARNGPRGRDRP